MSFNQVNLEPKKLLLAIVENLNAQFFADERANSKSLFRHLEENTPIPFMLIDLKEEGQIRCNLTLDSSEYVGKLNFSNFRKCLSMMMLQITDTLRTEGSINQMQSETGEIVFNLPGIVKTGEITNFLACGLKQISPGINHVNLMFLNPENYVAAAKTGNTKDSKPQ